MDPTRKQWFVGCGANGYVAFRADKEPTRANYGAEYFALIGPFRTRRGAEYMARYGRGNPHLQHVNDAERYAKIEARA